MKYEQVTDSITLLKMNQGSNVTCVALEDELIFLDTGLNTIVAQEFRKNMEEKYSKKATTLILTHGHIDHIGSLKDIKEYTGAKVAIHRLDKECVERGEWLDSHKPKGVGRWGRMLGKIGIPLIKWLYPEAPPTEVDVTIENDEFSLVDYGIAGRVIHTPGHSIGSVSVLLNSGEAFVGDLAMNKFPLKRNPGLPILADDITKVKESWQQLLRFNVKTVYPGHGHPFSVEIIKKALT